MSNTDVSYKKQELITIRVHRKSTPFFCEVSVTHITFKSDRGKNTSTLKSKRPIVIWDMDIS